MYAHTQTHSQHREIHISPGRGMKNWGEKQAVTDGNGKAQSLEPAAIERQQLAARPSQQVLNGTICATYRPWQLPLPNRRGFDYESIILMLLVVVVVVRVAVLRKWRLRLIYEADVTWDVEKLNDFFGVIYFGPVLLWKHDVRLILGWLKFWGAIRASLTCIILQRAWWWLRDLMCCAIDRTLPKTLISTFCWKLNDTLWSYFHFHIPSEAQPTAGLCQIGATLSLPASCSISKELVTRLALSTVRNAVPSICADLVAGGEFSSSPEKATNMKTSWRCKKAVEK